MIGSASGCRPAVVPRRGAGRSVLAWRVAALMSFPSTATSGLPDAAPYAGARPESKPRLNGLLLGIAVVGLGTVVLGAFVAGITGEA